MQILGLKGVVGDEALSVLVVSMRLVSGLYFTSIDLVMTGFASDWTCHAALLRAFLGETKLNLGGDTDCFNFNVSRISRFVYTYVLPIS